MSTATRDQPSGSLRVSDADRDRAIAELSEHYQAGRLTTEEFEDRSGRALAARTSADLAALFTDLPRRQAPVTSAASAPASPGRSWPARVPVVPVAILAVVVVLALLGGHPFHFAWLPVVAIIVVRLLVGGRGRRRDRRAPW
jgi:Flp pilus assembly protein TadB